MRSFFLVLTLVGCSSFSLFSQPGYSANDYVPPYDAPFGYGANPGGHAGWTDEQLSDIAIGNQELGIAGAGVTTLRPALTEKFLEAWRYDIRVNAFLSYAARGAVNNTPFIGYPSEAHRDKTFHCPGKKSEVFANLYEPIWDDGANDTPVNDNNYYALYVYKLVQNYKDYVRFYEVWNEPDYSRANFLVQQREHPRNWWDNNPDPCDFDLHAPIFYYIRMLRITYEIVKTYDPDSYVAVGGLGYAAFADAIMRNTDNPASGAISSEYPLKGGAYFDVLSYHSYPHIDGSLRTWNSETLRWDYFRHSDMAVENGLLRLKREFQEVLFDHGYDGNMYPEKLWIVTESNIPRKVMTDNIGSSISQVNYMIKALVAAQANDIEQVHIYKLGDTDYFHDAVSEFHLMGLYSTLKNNPVYQQKYNDVGYSYKTTSDLLSGKRYDEEETQRLNLPDELKGAAFKDNAGEFIYVLWVKTFGDMTEYTPPTTLNLAQRIQSDSVFVYHWDYARTQEDVKVDARNIALNGTPLFIVPDGIQSDIEEDTPDLPAILIGTFPNPFKDRLNVQLELLQEDEVIMKVYDRLGQLVTTVLPMSRLSAGDYEYNLETTLWNPGVHYLQVQLIEQGLVVHVLIVKSAE